MFFKKYGILVTSVILSIFISYNVVASRDIALVLDDTISMEVEIDQIKRNFNSTFVEVLASNDYNIDNVILITFNDNEIFDRRLRRFRIDSNKEVVKTRAKTKVVEELYASLDGIKVDGGGRCPEPCLSGIERALQECSNNSYIYVFTDASPSDFKKEEEIAALAWNKSIQMNFFVTGRCSYSGNYSVFERLAKNSSGEIFRIAMNDVDQMMQFLKYSMKEFKSNFLSEKISGEKTFDFTVEGVDDIYIAANGFKPSEAVDVKLSDPSGNDVPTTTVVQTNNTKIYSIANPDGTYTLHVNSTSDGTVSVVGLVDDIVQLPY